MKKVLLLVSLTLCLPLCLAALAVPTQARPYVLAIHALNSDGPEGFEMKGYAQTAGENLDGLCVSLHLYPSINSDALFVNSTAFKLKLTVALKDESHNDIERFFLDFSGMVNYIAAAGGVFGLVDTDNIYFKNEIVVEGQSWIVTTVLSKSITGGAHYIMTSFMRPTSPCQELADFY